MKSKCPDKLYFDPSLLYEFNCYSDQLSPESTFIWKVNNLKLNGIITDSYYKMHADNTTSIGSTLTTKLHENVKSVSCSLGDATSVIIAEGTKASSSIFVFSHELTPLNVSLHFCMFYHWHTIQETLNSYICCKYSVTYQTKSVINKINVN